MLQRFFRRFRKRPYYPLLPRVLDGYTHYSFGIVSTGSALILRNDTGHTLFFELTGEASAWSPLLVPEQTVFFTDLPTGALSVYAMKRPGGVAILAPPPEKI